MSKIKYYYDTETCRYERYKTTTKDFILNTVGFFVTTFLLAIAIVFGYTRFFDPPHVAVIKEQNKELKYYYEIMDKELKDLDAMADFLQEKDRSIYRIIMESEPLPSSVWNGGTGGYKKYKELINKNLGYETVILSKLKQLDKIKRKMYLQTKSYDKILELAKGKETMLSHIPSIQPLSRKDLNRLASGFGMRLHPIHKVWRLHAGLDFSAPRGTPIYATGDGVVKLTKYSYKGYGRQVEINHGYGYVTKYAHMQKYVVKQGQKVKRGQLIGYVGNSGSSTAPHLHYEIIKKVKKINPIHYMYRDFTDEEYNELLKKASEKNQSLS
ncbi:MAG: M23 family metallopeptidase [Cyclobacteriaceae bacterium]